MIVLVFIYYTRTLYKSILSPPTPLVKGGSKKSTLSKGGARNQPCQRGEQEINFVKGGSKKSTLSKGGARNKLCQRGE